MVVINIEWIDAGREPQEKPDPEFPHGVDLDFTEGAQSCMTELPYPAPRCGYFHVTCDICGMEVLVTTAGRPDDPRSVKLPCKLTRH